MNHAIDQIAQIKARIGRDCAELLSLENTSALAFPIVAQGFLASGLWACFGSSKELHLLNRVPLGTQPGEAGTIVGLVPAEQVDPDTNLTMAELAADRLKFYGWAAGLLHITDETRLSEIRAEAKAYIDETRASFPHIRAIEHGEYLARAVVKLGSAVKAWDDARRRDAANTSALATEMENAGEHVDRCIKAFRDRAQRFGRVGDDTDIGSFTANAPGVRPLSDGDIREAVEEALAAIPGEAWTPPPPAEPVDEATIRAYLEAAACDLLTNLETDNFSIAFQDDTGEHRAMFVGDPVKMLQGLMDSNERNRRQDVTISGPVEEAIHRAMRDPNHGDEARATPPAGPYPGGEAIHVLFQTSDGRRAEGTVNASYVTQRIRELESTDRPPVEWHRPGECEGTLILDRARDGTPRMHLRKESPETLHVEPPILAVPLSGGGEFQVALLRGEDGLLRHDPNFCIVAPQDDETAANAGRLLALWRSSGWFYNDRETAIVRRIQEFLERLSITGGDTRSTRRFQSRVHPWMHETFGPEISADKAERRARFLEEALELHQAIGGNAAEARELVSYVHGQRHVGEVRQEVGGVMVTLAALCLAAGVDMHHEADVELTRIWDPETMAKIREKQKTKPPSSPLPSVAKNSELPNMVSYPVHPSHVQQATYEADRLLTAGRFPAAKTREKWIAERAGVIAMNRKGQP